MNSPDFQIQERKAAAKATSSLRQSFRSVIASVFKKVSGALQKSTFTSRFRDGLLDRLILKSPRYSFQTHFGSTLSGTTAETSRKGTEVNSFERFISGQKREVKAHSRAGSKVKSHVKGIRYKATNHIAEALKRTNALETLATDLGENRIVEITSQIQF